MTGTRTIRALLWAAALVTWGARLDAQGVTGAAVQGTVMRTDSFPVAEATVLITKVSTGERWQTATGAGGRFLLEHLSVGGPYRVDVRAIGFEPASRSDVFLSLRQRLTLDVRLVPAELQLAELVVRGEPDSRINASRTGPAYTVSDTIITRFPMFGRDFSMLAFLSPFVSGGPVGFTFAGGSDRLNNVLLDGTSINDLKGDSREGGLPPLPPEALEEVQVHVATFDVRVGNVTGGQINAVTKSGTNQWHGSAFGHLEAQSLSGTDPTGSRGSPFNTKEVGVTLGGPIVRDRLALFAIASGVEFSQFTFLAPTPDTTGGADSAGTGIRYATMVRFQEILRGYGVDPGTFDAKRNGQSRRTAFAKLTGQLGINNRLELSHEYRYGVFRVPYTADGRFNAGLSSNAEEDPVYDNTTRLNWTAAFGSRWTNELVLGRKASRHRCIPSGDFPTVMVEADAGRIVAGTQEVCRGQVNGQSLLEMTDNVGLAAGEHQLTFGTHNELIRLYDDDLGLLNSTGRWSFASLDALEQGTPSGYERDVPGPFSGTAALPDFRAVQLGLYAQDEWSPTPRLRLTAGVRLDIPFLPTEPGYNAAVFDAFGINTSRTPTGHAQWSPRLGMSYDPSGRGATYLRGGIGLFEGRPLYGWLEEAYRGTGLQSLFLQCFGDDVPAFTLGADQPTQCGGGEQPTPIITAFDPAFRYPQNLKVSLGVDQRLPWEVVGTLDLIYTRGTHQFAVRDVNLLPPSGVSAGEGGRPLYGTIDSTGVPTPTRRSGAFDQVIQVTNSSGDRAYALAVQLQKRFANGNELNVAYTHTDAKSRQDNPNVWSYGNLFSTALDGTWEERNLRTSRYSLTHRVGLLGTANLPFGIRLGVIYYGWSGEPFTYRVGGDANADGLGAGFFDANDPVYVPRDANDITLMDPDDLSQPATAETVAELMAYIDSESCLRSQRGRLLRRNSCRQPWQGEMDGRLSTVVRLSGGHAVEITGDMFNVLNFLDADWGRKYATEGNTLLDLVGYDEAKGRGKYVFAPPRRHVLQFDSTRWQARLSVRYTF